MKKINRGMLALTLSAAALLGTTAAAQEEKTVVTFQTWNPADSGEGSPIYQIIDAFEAENPDIEINYVQDYRTAFKDALCLCNPVLASKQEIKRMPPAVIQTCQLDSLRLDGDTCAAMLQSEKIPVVYRCMPGAVHGVTENEGPMQEDAIRFLIEGMKEISQNNDKRKQ